TATNQYSVRGTLSATNAMGSQLITITDGTVSTTATLAGNEPTSFTLNGLTSSGTLHTVTASATNCGMASTTYTAPASCSGTPTAGLGDYVWNDSNKNGSQDAGEAPIPGVVATLFINGVSSATTLTNATGFYSFTGLTPGSSLSYSAGFSTPAGFSATSQNQGDDDTKDSDADPFTGKTQSVTLLAGEFNPTLDAGFYGANPELRLDKRVDKSKAKVGDVLSYSLVLTNTGSALASHVVVQDSTSSGLSYVLNSATAPVGTTFTQGTPISLWTVASLSPGQSLTLTFQAKADTSGILYNTATIPGDTAKVCTSIPVKMCLGDEYTLTAPAGRPSYRWFKDGVLIPGQSNNELVVNEPGAYSLENDNTGGLCPTFSCCPFILELDTLPNYQAVAIAATCQGNTPQNNGQVVLSQFNPKHTYQYSVGASFNAAASLSGPAQVIPANGVLVSTLASPGVATTYTVRVYNQSGCYTDMTVLL
ncbi:SdrD B-like domain-containing protein, partial [Spirosoma endbachense]|uniref:SdrD B-like domain-containing protein n=1 Tax=Spirosoma endbachense TaxID=2666025 RepID=UPI0018E09345